jgi:hypothetical protein
MIFGVFACALRDELISAAMAGEGEALRKLILALPADLPADLRRQERDRRIRDMAGRLMAGYPSWTDHRVAKALAAAGSAIEAGATSLHGPDFDPVDNIDRAYVALQISSMLRWCPSRRDGSKWPRLRQILNIIS